MALEGRFAWPMSDLTVRPANPDDLELLTSALGDDEYFADRLARQHAGRGELLVAWLNNSPVGHIYLWWEQPDEPEIDRHLPGVPVLQHLHVHVRQRRQGIGTQLLIAAERRLRRRGHRQIALAVAVVNVDAARLYRRLGWRTWRFGPVECRARDTTLGPVEVCDIFVRKVV